MIARPPISTRTDTLCPDTPLFRSAFRQDGIGGARTAHRAFAPDLRHPHLARQRAVHCLEIARRALGVLDIPARQPGRQVARIKFDAMRLSALQAAHRDHRSEEHTSELQSLMRISYAVFCLKKKNKEINYKETTQHKQ